MFLLGQRVSPPIRAAIAVMLIVVGIAVHRWILDLAGGLILALACWQLATRRGRGRGRGRGTGTGTGTGTGRSR